MNFFCERTMARSRALALSGGIALLVAACSSAPPTTFDLSAAPRLGRSGGLAPISIGAPTAIGLIDTERLVVRSQGNVVAYLPGAQWSDRLPKLVQARLIESFENAREISQVSRPGDRIVATNQLSADIRTFEVQTDTREAVVEITVRIVGDQSGRVGAANMFVARVPVAEITGPAAAVALDQATQQVLAQIVRWVAARS